MDPAIQPELVPRNYQDALIRICVQQNSIIFLPTGAGKTFIAVCAIKELVRDDFARSYSEGGKLCVFLVNTVTLVEQHSKYMQQNTTYTIGSYTGDMNVDFWSREEWLKEYDTHNVIIMTAQIFKNCISASFIDMNKVNILVFDECHHGVDNHPMREIMKFFNHLTEPPRVIGLTATLLNGNVNPSRVLDEVIKLETTFHAKVATVDALMNVIGYSTNPREELVMYQSTAVHPIINEACAMLCELETTLRAFKVRVKPLAKPETAHLKHLNKEKPYEKYYKILMDAQVQFKMLGIAGARIACITYTIHLELEKRLSTQLNTTHVINAMITLFTEIREKLEPIHLALPEAQRTLLLSSNKVQKLMQTLTTFHNTSTQELCGIVFVERKNTAILLYHLLNDVRKHYDNMEFIKPDFIIGSNANPLNCSTEALYYAKMNRKIIHKFNSKEVNLLIASNVIEEGVDVQMCSLVIKFDPIKDYRAYIQSKGRARHATSLYYIMTEKEERPEFMNRYEKFQTIEQNLNDYLIGSNEKRVMPRQRDIDSMYAETKIFFVDGPGSANVTEISATMLLMMYCDSAKADMYTTYEPVLYVEQKGSQFRVHVELPVFSPLKDLIAGEWRATKKEAKGSASFETCKRLFELGELTQNMLPKPMVIDKTSLEYLFGHWPEDGEKSDGVTKKPRSYVRRVPKAVNSPIEPGAPAYLHIIEMTPLLDNSQATLNKLYAGDLCFGLVTAKKLPQICAFPTFVTLGQISVMLRVNENSVVLSATQLAGVKRFHHLIFDGVLDVLARKSYLLLGNNRPFYSYLVPMLKSTKSINFDIINDHEDIVDVSNVLTNEEKQNLVVNNETYLEKIVTPVYRDHLKHHLVMEVCDYITAASPFPNNEFQSYADYYECKYERFIVNKNLPMLLVRPLSSGMNCLRPRGAASKRKREETFETLVQHFSPELCVKQNFPAQLWLSATLLPSALLRIEHLLIAEEFRSKIAKEAKLGEINVETWEPLEVDSRLTRYESNVPSEKVRKADTSEELPTELKAQQVSDMIATSSINKAYNDIMIDAEYPWEADKEPVHFARSLDVSPLDIDLFCKFISAPVKSPTAAAEQVASRATGCLAINYVPPDYQYKPIALLTQKARSKGPELRSVYEALATAKAHEIVNLERLETLGDAFLKMAASLYIFNKFPDFSEGQATELKGKLVSNRNLFYLAQLHGIGGLVMNGDFQPKDEWLPPGYCTPVELDEIIQRKEASIGCLFEIDIPRDGQINGVLTEDTYSQIEQIRQVVEDDERSDNAYASMCRFLGCHVLGDKTLADAVEALIGVYVESMGIAGGLKFIQWLKLIPEDAIKATFGAPTTSPIIKFGSTDRDIGAQLSNMEASQVERILGYQFKNRAFLLQALTHASYSSNRITQSYQRLEFIGDAVLDLLITLYIFENNTQLDPGKLTDLRSALVNNETFAAYVIKLRLHKYLKNHNSKLNGLIEKFDAYQQMRKNEITSDVLMLLDEDNLQLAENIDVPKVLGDLFESITGAIFLDSGKDLSAVWQVIHRIMWRELDAFAKDIPLNPIRMLYETLAPLRPKFSDPVDVDAGCRTMMKLDFNLNGSLTRVHGFGDNKANAKKAAAKVALRLLSVKRK